MKIKTEPEGIWREYEKAAEHNGRLYDGKGLYNTVEENENFYIGNQWAGVDAPDLDKPVLNFTKRVVAYCIAMLVSDDIAARLAPFAEDEQQKGMCDLLAKEVDRVMERTKLKALARDALRNAAVDGDCDWYFYFDADAPTGQAATGDIRMENFENTKVLFGNPYTPEVEAQPYILLVRRLQLQAARELARAEGMSADEAEEIQPDGETRYGENADDELVTCLVKMWKENGTVCWTEVTRDKVLRKARDTGYRRFPVCHMCWEKVRSSYHGQAILTGLIPNQRFVNKVWAMMMLQIKTMAFPKIFYDENAFPNGWSNRIGEAVAVVGPPDKVVAQNIRGADASAQVMELVEKTISYTKDFMGANDAALGNVTPNNTSAIIAVQKATAAPLELQKLAYYQFVEDAVRIILEIIRCDYGVRWVQTDGEMGPMLEQVDFGAYSLDEMELNIDIGESSYWNELVQIQTADNLVQQKIITDAADYLERIPDKYIKNKQDLIEKIRARAELVGQQTPVNAGAQPLGNAVNAGGVQQLVGG